MINTFDIIFWGLVLTGGFFGFQIGIVASIFYVFSGFAGMWAAHHFSLTSGVNFYFLFLLGTAAVILAGYIASRLFEGFFLGALDRLVGATVLLILSVVVIGFAVMPISKFLPEKTQEMVADSYSNSHIMPYVKRVFPYVKKIDFRQLKDYLPENIDILNAHTSK